MSGRAACLWPIRTGKTTVEKIPKADGPRVVRGGTYAVDDRKARCLVRLEADPTQATLSTGFRCARDAQ